MAAIGGEVSRPLKYLYIFYDCEATGGDRRSDRIIEIGAVVTSKSGARPSSADTFQSLCFCEREISPVARELTGLTNWDLRHEPPLEEVLRQFFEWVGERVAEADRERGEHYTPVLVAHGGFHMDFPMLLAEMERVSGGYRFILSHHLYRKMQSLNIHFGDSYQMCKYLEDNSDFLLAGMEKKGVESLYQAFFHEKHSGHRALNDAQALHRLFTESPLKLRLEQMRLKSAREAYDHWKAIQLTKAGITFPKGRKLVSEGVYLEHMESSYQQSSSTFRDYLKGKGIHRPSAELMQYFESQDH